MVESVRTQETVESDLKKVQEELAELINKINKQWYKEKWDEEKIKGLEESEKKYQDELDNLKKDIPSNSNEKSTEKKESSEMTPEEAINYLNTLKGKSWSELVKENDKWITAIQVVLTDRGYKVWVIDWILGWKRSNTRKGVRDFQKDNGLVPDGLPGPKTIEAILGGEKKDRENKDREKKDEDNKIEEKKDTEWNVFKWTIKDWKPRNGTYTTKDGESYTVENWNIK